MRISIILFLFLSIARAEVPNYKSTDNEGMNKSERFESVEKHLITLTQAIKGFENKIDENAKKVKDLEKIIESYKSDIDKKMKERLGEKTIDASSSETHNELKKLKSDIFDIQDAIKELKKSKTK